MVTQMLTKLERPDLPTSWERALAVPAVAWKTGTSYGHRDAWAVGYSADHVIGVWVGNMSRHLRRVFCGIVVLFLFAAVDGACMAAVAGEEPLGLLVFDRPPYYMAGRTGAAYAAELGTMQVNEEIDALRTFGFSPTQFLVLPRMIALVLMMPLLCIYADLMGIAGGFIVGVFMLKINPLQYLSHTWQSVHLVNFWIGHGCKLGKRSAFTGFVINFRIGFVICVLR